MKFSKLELRRKIEWKMLVKELNDAGYFINIPTNKSMIHVMSHNGMHDTLMGVWVVITKLSIANVKVEREPDDKVVGIVFE